MAELEINFDPVDTLTVGVAGEPGQRTFYLEGIAGGERCTLVVEKVQVLELGRTLLQVLESGDDVPPAPEPVAGPDGPPGWRVGSIQVAIDEEATHAILLVEELVDAEGWRGEPRSARFVAGLGQIRALAARALEVVEGGRPICPLCQRPVEPRGHVCPASNGHHPKV